MEANKKKIQKKSKNLKKAHKHTNFYNKKTKECKELFKAKVSADTLYRCQTVELSTTNIQHKPNLEQEKKDKIHKKDKKKSLDQDSEKWIKLEDWKNFKRKPQKIKK